MSDWSTKFSKRCAEMPRSTVREFLKHARRPGVISFAGGLPANELFPVEAFRRAADRVLSENSKNALQYGQTEGVLELREYLARRFAVGVESVLITTGGQQALDLVGRVLLDESDTVLVENPTYLSLLSAWRPLGVRFRGVAMDAEGLALLDLREAVRERPKILYCMPNFQNPSGVTLSLARREAVAALAADNNLIVVEDDAYGALRFEGEHLRSLHQLLSAKAIYVGTFSKVLAPGLRTGWIVAPPEIAEVLVRAKQALDLHTSTFTQHVAWQLIKEGLLERHVPLLCSQYKMRRDAMLASLQKEMPPGVSWTRPEGGMFLLLSLPPGYSGRELSKRALEREVLVVPGEEFHVRSGENTIRVNFTNSSLLEIAMGAEILGTIVHEMLRCPAAHT